MSAAARRAGRPPLLRRAMDSDNGRLWLAMVPATAVMVLLQTVFRELLPEVNGPETLRRRLYLVTGLTLALLHLLYLALTLGRFLPRSARELERDLRTVSRGSRRDSWTARLGLTYGSTLHWTTSVSVLTLLLVIGVMLDPAARGDVVLRVVCAAVVASSWAVLLVSQALEYGRIAAQGGGVEFEDTPDPDFSDFLALAAFVSAMFGTGDARLSGRRARAAMRAHVLVGFAFNSMLVASLATLLLSAA